jgi:L-2-hydroxyglutarate oxidase LhgO
MGPSGHQFVIVGAGITGLTIARELVSAGADDIAILDKEAAAGRHASGRNSGVLHAGLYYSSDTLKARYCAQGNRLMKSFCREKNLAVREIGKVIVTRDEAQNQTLETLKAKADACGARARLIGSEELRRLEPHAATYERALFSPDTAVISPKQVLAALEEELIGSGRVSISYRTAVRGPRGTKTVATSRGPLAYDTLINAAGAHADRIAHRFGVGREFKILPFKGTYRKLTRRRAYLVQGNIYPVPDLRNPFLGAHFTRSVDDSVYVGPTAIPALGRENYGFFEGWGWDTPLVLLRDGVLLLENSEFRTAALTEPKKYLKVVLFRDARRLIPELRLSDLEETSKVGIRPQLVHWPTRRLVMDFVMHSDSETFHVLNAVSPAFTCSMALAKHAVNLVLARRGAADAVSV